MHLSLHTDYALRTLIYLAAHRDRLVSTREVSQAYGISRNHLVRVVQTLGRGGFVRLYPGRNGGIELGREPAGIRLGDVFRCAEPDLKLVECFDPLRNTCPIAPVCGLKGVLREAGNAFLAVLDRYSLADLAGPPKAGELAAHFMVPGAAAARTAAPARPRRSSRRSA